MVIVVPFEPTLDEGCQALMMRCITDVKKRDFNAEQDKDILDLASFYNIQEGSLLLVVLEAIEQERNKVVGTLGLKNSGMNANKKNWNAQKTLC